ncbi:hypothetical protein D9615_008311 [Tricholomella constricta]|uniref:Uncharacterized protein n=1 Tax=Tricholomella constricta TaxID=117010 RepID=A0A8H5M5B6_9AGAR|nr:hypothetical protein D9615_008311 [Tricholomella constricta]
MASSPKKPVHKVSSLTPGQITLLGSAIVLASLGGFYLNLLRIQKKKDAEGNLPHYEYLMGHVASRRTDNPNPNATNLPISRFAPRTSFVPVPLRGAEQRNGHSTIPDFNLSAASADPRARFEQPTPQRPKEPGSSVVYTKVADEAKSYGRSVPQKGKMDDEDV